MHPFFAHICFLAPCRVWDLETGQCKAILRGHEDPIVGVHVNKAGTAFISTDGLTIR